MNSDTVHLEYISIPDTHEIILPFGTISSLQGHSKTAFKSSNDYCSPTLWKNRILMQNIFSAVEIQIFLHQK